MPANPETRAITIHVSDVVYAGLIAHGRKAGYTPTLYAKLLFQAAYAARCGKGEADPLLVDCVERSLTKGPARPAPSAVSTVALPTVETILRPVPIPVLMPVPVAVPLVLEVHDPAPIAPAPADPPKPVVATAAPITAPQPSETPVRPSVVEETIDVSGLVRSIRALAAAGNNAKEIAVEIGRPAAFVREILAGRLA